MTRTLIVVLVSLAAHASTARADVELGFGVTSQLARSSSLDAITDNNFLTRPSWTLAYRLQPTALGSLAVDISTQGGTIDDVTFQRIDTELSTLQIMLGVRGQRNVWRALSVHSRLAAGLQWGTVSLIGNAGQTPIKNTARASIASIHAGADYQLLGDREKGRALAVRLELGYVLASRLRFEAEPDSDDSDVIRIPEQLESMGSVSLSGFGARIGLALDF